MNRILDNAWQIAPVIAGLLALARWIDAYRLAADIPLPVPVAWRVVLARYNLLAVSTHIYKALSVLKRPTSNG